MTTVPTDMEKILKVLGKINHLIKYLDQPYKYRDGSRRGMMVGQLMDLKNQEPDLHLVITRNGAQLWEGNPEDENTTGYRSLTSDHKSAISLYLSIGDTNANADAVIGRIKAMISMAIQEKQKAITSLEKCLTELD